MIPSQKKQFFLNSYLILKFKKACGLVYANNNVKIVGGIAANQGSWPSIAFITWKYRAYYTLPTGVTVLVSSAIQCDGTLISTTRVLTAGKNGIFRTLASGNNIF